MDTDHHDLSTRLCDVLDNIGASEDIRQTYWDISMINEISKTVIYPTFVVSGDNSFYHFGSYCEGTTTLGLQNDIDLLICAEVMPVIDSIVEATEKPCYLMVKHCKTKPGYAQLQKVLRGIPQCNSLGPVIQGKEEYDEYGRTCLTNRPIRHKNVSTETINGPAVTFARGTDRFDCVYALRCRTVPIMANSWIHRTRQYDWPSHKQIERMKSFGCFLVGVGHPNSHNKSIEWRISFSLQERELMLGLNPTQHQCYILLKIIKTDLIEPITGKSVSSYHCKTCLFHTVETSETSIWTPENLILCTRMCLERLLDWSKNGNCPNYFIPDENMFDKLDKQTLENVSTELTDILSSGMEFLFRLECDNLGNLLYENLSGMPHNKGDTNKYIVLKHTLRVVYSNYALRNMSLRKIPAESNQSLFKIERLLTHLQEINHATEHSVREIRLALSYIVPQIHLQKAQSLASVEIRRKGTITNYLLPLDIPLNIIESAPSSCNSARLSLAACYLQYGMLEASEQLLLAVEVSFKGNVVSICSCNFATVDQLTSLEKKLITHSYNDTTLECLEQYTTGCFVFLQSQASIVHPALQYEMYRSVYTSVESRDEDVDYWFDWVVVDPMVYMFFLQYILCNKTNRPGHRRRIVDTFRRQITEQGAHLGHSETAYNLLGWMLIQENRAIEAWQCFCRSWIIRPFHNAAKLHIIFLLNDALR